MSSHLAVPISCLLFVVISHPRFSVLQSMLGHSAHSWALCTNETRKYRNEIVFMLWMSCVTVLMQDEPNWWKKYSRVQCWLQCIGQLLIILSDFNIRGLKNLEDEWIWTLQFDFKIHNVKINSNGNVMKQNSNHTLWLKNDHYWPTIIFTHLLFQSD